jgi:hypothetical protein
VCKQVAVAEQPYYRWKKEYGGLLMEQAKRLKELEERERPAQASVLPARSLIRQSCRKPLREMPEALTPAGLPQASIRARQHAVCYL